MARVEWAGGQCILLRLDEKSLVIPSSDVLSICMGWDMLSLHCRCKLYLYHSFACRHIAPCDKPNKHQTFTSFEQIRRIHQMFRMCQRQKQYMALVERHFFQFCVPVRSVLQQVDKSIRPVVCLFRGSVHRGCWSALVMA